VADSILMGKVNAAAVNHDEQRKSALHFKLVTWWAHYRWSRSNSAKGRVLLFLPLP